MIIYQPKAKGPFEVDGYHDPDSKKKESIVYTPPAWVAATVYYQRSAADVDVVIPTVFAGLYFKVSTPGKSGATEPTWPTKPGVKVVDGSVIWESAAYDLLPPGVTISTSTWASDHSAVTLGSPAITGGVTTTLISTVPANVASFNVTNHVVFSNGEEDDMTLLFKVAQR